jgi:hypothetical protein
MHGRGAFDSLGGPREEFVGSRRPADFEIPLREPQRSVAISARLKPEFRRVVGEGFWVALHQFVIARRNQLAQTGRLVRASRIAEDARELGSVVRII